MAGEFLTDIIIKKLPSIVFWVFVAFTIVWFFAFIGLLTLGAIITLRNLALMWAIGFYVMGFAAIGRTRFMYRSGFDPKNIVDLVTQINVSPVRPIPTIVEGTIIGKGAPGYYFSDDLFFQDSTGLMYIDYRLGSLISSGLSPK